MKTTSRPALACFAIVLALIWLASASPSRADAEKRIAFVAGNAAYQGGALATTANDAGLIAQTLQAAGFDVTGARDLDGESLRAAFRDFLDKAQASGPDTVAFVYLAGYGLQLDGENYFVPVDARIASAADVAVEALRVSDYMKRLSGLSLKAAFIVLDAARESPFAKSGPPLAGGLALADTEPNMLLAFNATPGTAAPAESGPYGAYARALAEMIREGGMPPADLFDGVRLRVNEETKGAEVPWDASRIAAPFVFFERAADAPPPALSAGKINAMRSRPLRGLGAQDAYAAAIERDTLQGYEEFLAAYSSDPLANRVRALLAARREAIIWQRTCRAGTPDAYWSYLNRYPRGPHAASARRRLATLAAAEEPPPSFTPMVYDVPPPPPAEIIYVDRPVLVFSDPVFGFPPPPPPVIFLAPPPPYLYFPPPPPPVALFVLPAPPFVPVPGWISPPPHLAPPPHNIIFNNIHNTTVINTETNIIPPSVPGGAGAGAGVAAGIAAGASAARVALPPSVARKAATIGGQGAPPFKPGPFAPGTPAGQPAALPSSQVPAGQALPAAPGKPLPGFGQKPGKPAGRPGALPSTQLPAGQALPAAPGKPLPGFGQKPGTPAGQPGALPSTQLPAGQALPSAAGKPLPGFGQKPGTPAGPPGTLPSTQVPAGQALPGLPGKPLPGPGQKPQKPQQALPGALQNPTPGTSLQNKPPVTHVLPSGQNQSPLPGGDGAPKGAKPGPVAPPGVLPPAAQQPLGKRPTGQLPPQNQLAPSGAIGGPAMSGPAPAMRPDPQQTRPNTPQQVQQPRLPQPAYQPQQIQQPRPPQPADQPPHPAPQIQQQQPARPSSQKPLVPQQN